MLRTVTALGLALAALLPAAGAHAQAGIKVGELSCTIGRDVGVILGSRAALKCRYDSVSGTDEEYDGTITKLGLDIGVSEETKLVWAVIAPASNTSKGALAGRYFGASAEVTAGAGVGANVLVGGFDRSITLQPLSVQGEVGADVTAALAEMRLEAR